MMRLFNPEARIIGATAGLGLTAASLLAPGCGAAEPFLRALHQTPKAEALVDCKAVLTWLGPYTVQIAVSDPALGVDEKLEQVVLDWGDGTEGMTYLPPEDDTSAHEPSPQHTYVPGAGAFTLRATVGIEEGGTLYPRTDDECLLTVQVPHE